MLITPALYQHRSASSPTTAAASDDEQIPFGIREFQLQPQTQASGSTPQLQIEGGLPSCDGASLESLCPTRLGGRLTALRALGVNAIRTAHNPPSPSFSTSATAWASR